jgi:hypothetical protein
LKGSNIVRHPEYFLIEVESAKNNPDGFSFKVLVDARRSNCVGQFLADFLVRMGIVLGNKKSFISCKISTAKGMMKAVPLVRVGDSTMRAACKRLIGAVGWIPGIMLCILASKVAPWPLWRPAYPTRRFMIFGAGRALIWLAGMPLGIRSPERLRPRSFIYEVDQIIRVKRRVEMD